MAILQRGLGAFAISGPTEIRNDGGSGVAEVREVSAGSGVTLWRFSATIPRYLPGRNEQRT